MSQRACRVRMRMCVVGVAACLVGGAVIAGDLNPPAGPVMPTMKTLDEVEPRIPLDPADVPIIINQSGSYYLTGNIQATVSGTVAITIAADDVTLDLMGHAITNSEIAFFSSGIALTTAADNASVTNGTISGCSADGVSGDTAPPFTVTRLRVDSCGAFGIRGSAGTMVEHCVARGNLEGIRVGVGGVIDSCIASDNTLDGIETAQSVTVRRCTANSNGQSGINTGALSDVRECRTIDNGLDGVFLNGGGSATGCFSYNNGRNGISSTGAGRIDACTALANDLHGIEVLNDCQVISNICDNNGVLSTEGAGIYGSGSDCRIESNTLTDNDYGVRVISNGNLIVRCSASGNSVANFNLAAGNDSGTIQTSPVGAGAWDNFEF
ncbi:MAG: right-handed parallel beta-helix repeat-containing protein [Phycisphaeraceae bacterium]|nr:right-handed parallel beta-helix repeat-containing protein [Phycisphaerales bacterium]MCB9841925.1 right-handed parallel beta-helix repeat-containing protein [Phycisphaeraceae bacterium]